MSSICGPHCDEHCRRCIITHNIGMALYNKQKYQSATAVSYTHLTLPTILLV